MATNSIILQALHEDAVKADITTKLLVPAQSTSKAVIIAKESAVMCATNIAVQIFKQLDRNIKCQIKIKDGEAAKKGDVVISIEGKTRAILTGERTALNFLGHLSGIATYTHAFITKIKPYTTKIMDTRKTTPGLRNLEKYAVKCGGGTNHRNDLSESVFIKDNHWQSGIKNLSIKETLTSLRQKTKKLIIVEVDNLIQFREVHECLPDVILLDNMSINEMKKAVLLNNKISQVKRPKLEASGNVNLNTVKKIAASGVDRISIGALTHSVKNIDFSLELI